MTDTVRGHREYLRAAQALADREWQARLWTRRSTRYRRAVAAVMAIAATALTLAILFAVRG